MNERTARGLWRPVTLGLLATTAVTVGVAGFAKAQETIEPAAPAMTDTPPGDATPSVGSAPMSAESSSAEAPPTAEAPPSDQRVKQAANLISEALRLGNSNLAARPVAVRRSASLLPLLTGSARDTLSARWTRLAQNNTVSRQVRHDAYSAFFDVAAHRDAAFARRNALALPDPAARAGAFIDLSQVTEPRNWPLANDYAELARRAARQEKAPDIRARALTYVASHISSLNPETAEPALIEASGEVQSLGNPAKRDYLWVEIAGTAARIDLGLARKITARISDPKLKKMAADRVNLAEISQTTLTTTTSDRISALAQAASRYEQAAIPVLLQLPPQTDVLKALSDALPRIYPSAPATMDESVLERMWRYAAAAEPSVQRDTLQSRLARLMVLHDLWRGRAWGLRLGWKGGRQQVGAFLEQVLIARRSQVKAEPLRLESERNFNRALITARALPPAARAEALLLLAGQVLQ